MGGDGKLKSVKDLTGNTLTFTPNGITSSAGDLYVPFVRDAQGRITQITDTDQPHLPLQLRRGGQPRLRHAAGHRHARHLHLRRGAQLPQRQRPARQHRADRDLRPRRAARLRDRRARQHHALRVRPGARHHAPDQPRRRLRARAVRTPRGLVTSETDALGNTTSLHLRRQPQQADRDGRARPDDALHLRRFGQHHLGRLPAGPHHPRQLQPVRAAGHRHRRRSATRAPSSTTPTPRPSPSATASARSPPSPTTASATRSRTPTATARPPATPTTPSATSSPRPTRSTARPRTPTT